MREWRFLWRMAGHQRRRMVLGVALGLATGVAAVGLMAVAGGLLALCTVTGLAAAGTWNPAVGQLSAGIRFFAIGRTLGRYGERVITHDATLRIGGRLRAWFLARLARRAPVGPGGPERLRGGDLLDRLVADVDALTGFYIRAASPLVWSLALVGLVAVFLAWATSSAHSVSLALVGAETGLLLVAVVGLPWLGGRWGRSLGPGVAAQGRRLRVRLLESLQGRLELLVYNAAHLQVERLRSEGRAWIREQSSYSARVALLRGLSILVAGGGLVVVLWLGARAARTDGLAPTLVAASVLVVLTAFELVAPLATAAPDRERVREAADRVRSLLETPPQTPAPRKAATCPTDTTLRLEGVSFGYGHSDGHGDTYQESRIMPVIRDLDLTIPAGEHVALLGPSGAGKSTLAQLLVRLRDPDAGRITLGGVDLRDLAESDLRRLVTAVEQRPHLFTGTLRDNLKLGRPDASDDDLRNVLAQVALPPDDTRLPDGLDTWISGTGDPESPHHARRLSGGEARRVALARALLRDTPVLILDEPTEDLDPPTANRLLTSLLESGRERTLVLITHRRVVLERADRILLLESGKISEDGDHTTLVAADARYADLWRRVGRN